VWGRPPKARGHRGKKEHQLIQGSDSTNEDPTKVGVPPHPRFTRLAVRGGTLPPRRGEAGYSWGPGEEAQGQVFWQRRS